MTKRSQTVVLAVVSTAVLIVVSVFAATALLGADRTRWTGAGHGGMPMMSEPLRDGSWHGPMPHRMGEVMAASEAEYLTEMVAHHADAVTAARQLTRSDRLEMRELGASIVSTQTAQMDQMNDWLARWHRAAGPSAYRPMMRSLTGLDGDALDRTFLDDMIGHHMMAVMMSESFLAADLAEHPEAAALAKSISEEQRRELMAMRRWSRDWFGSRGYGSHGAGGHMWPMPRGQASG
jgi:uncharacterized protein (DUF305 family)